VAIAWSSDVADLPDQVDVSDELVLVVGQLLLTPKPTV
jgi:hypothetical protein